MHDACCFVNSVALPTRTGPSFTSVARARYLVGQFLFHTVDIYFPYTTDQAHLWDKAMCKDDYLAYLYRQYGRHERIHYKLVHCTFNALLRWNTIHWTELYRIMHHPNYRHVVFEDGASHFFATPLNAALLDARPSIVIHHTNYIDIATDVPLVKRLLRQVVQSTFDRPTVHNVLYSDSIGRRMKFVNNCVKLPIHGIPASFCIEALPFGHSVYIMGKIDDAHKNIRSIVHATSHVACDIHVYGVGRDMDMLREMQRTYGHIVYHGQIEHPIRDLRNHKIYISYSYKEGLCTTTMEALAMNKFALLLDCECNQFFKGMNNAFFFATDDDLVAQLRDLVRRPPQMEREKARLEWNRANAMFARYLQTIE